MITQEQINNAIQNCIWRQEIGGVYICRNRIHEIYNQGYREGYKDGAEDTKHEIAKKILISEVTE